MSYHKAYIAYLMIAITMSLYHFLDNYMISRAIMSNFISIKCRKKTSTISGGEFFLRDYALFAKLTWWPLGRVPPIHSTKS